MVAFFVMAVIGLLLTIVLPLVALARAAAARDAVAALERRIVALETRFRDTRVSDLPGAPSPASRASVTPTPAAPPAAPAAPRTHTDAPAPHDTASHSASETAATRLETRIGTRWMLYVGVAALVIGVGLFVRYAFANQWITEPLRVAVGGLAGAMVFRTGRRAITAGHRRFGTTLIGGSIAIWYLAVYAAMNLYGLLGPIAGFGLLIVITALAAVQADRLRSQPLATVAVLGGFGTPFLIGGDAVSYLSLFSYTTLLLGAIVYLARRCDWPSVSLLSFVLTGVTVPIWHARLFVPSTYLTAELFFTLYAALFLWVEHGMRGSSRPAVRWVRLVLWTTPAWYHLASLLVLTPHRLAFLVYLIVATGVGVVFPIRRDRTWARLVLWTAVAIPLFGWADSRPDQSWLVPATLSWLAIAAIHVAAQIELIKRVRTRLSAADILLVPAIGFGLFVGLYAVLAPSQYALIGPVAAGLSAAYAGLTAVLRRLDPRAARHALSVAITLALVAVAIWFDGLWGSVLLAAQGVGMVWIGLREQRTWVRSIGALLLGATTVRLLTLQLGPVPAVYTVVLNYRALLGFFLVGGLSAVAWLHARPESDGRRGYPVALATAVVTANLLMLVTLSTEIYAFWQIRATDFRAGSSAQFIQHLMLSATWGAYAAALIAAGFKRSYVPIRYLAIAIFSVTVIKVFTVDFSQLDSIYRILSSLALGLLLVGASYLYQRQAASTPPPENGR